MNLLQAADAPAPLRQPLRAQLYFSLFDDAGPAPGHAFMPAPGGAAAATLDLYCDRVASAVGRLAVKVFGMPDQDGVRLAHHPGRTLQLTNVLPRHAVV